MYEVSIPKKNIIPFEYEIEQETQSQKDPILCIKSGTSLLLVGR